MMCKIRSVTFLWCTLDNANDGYYFYSWVEEDWVIVYLTFTLLSGRS